MPPLRPINLEEDPIEALVNMGLFDRMNSVDSRNMKLAPSMENQASFSGLPPIDVPALNSSARQPSWTKPKMGMGDLKVMDDPDMQKVIASLQAEKKPAPQVSGPSLPMAGVPSMLIGATPAANSPEPEAVDPQAQMKKAIFGEGLEDSDIAAEQKLAREKNLYTDIGSALSQGLATMTNTKASPDLYNSLRERAGEGVANIKDLRKSKVEGMALQKENESNDPNSEGSRAARAMARQAGLNVSDKTTESQILKILPLSKEVLENKRAQIKAAADTAKLGSEASFKQLPKENQIAVESNAKDLEANQKTVELVNQVIKQMDDPGISEDQKTQIGLNSLKLINSTLGQDALSGEEAARASAYLQPATGLNPMNPRGFGATGRDLPGFKKQMETLNKRLNGVAKMHEGRINKAYGRAEQAAGGDYTPQQESGIERVMQANKVSREQAVDALKRAKKL